MSVEICKYFKKVDYIDYYYDRDTAEPHKIMMTKDVCLGTKYEERVYCRGNKNSKECVYYVDRSRKINSKNK